MLKSTIAILFTNLSLFSFSSAETIPPQCIETDCVNGPQHMRVGVRYTTPKGIGYNTGYTTLEGFFATPNYIQENWLPFLDLRGHIFDNGKFAANAGLGLRYLTQSRIWGLNTYYDYRNTNNQHYNQISAGFETLGKIWDFRINGYLPVGKKEISVFSNSFAGFKGHYMLLHSYKKFALKGFNAEAGAHIDHFKKAPLYFAAGPYYLTGVDQTTWGGQLRATVDLFKQYFRLEANTSYDHLFKWIGQAQASINIPFGRKERIIRKGNQSCSDRITLSTRAVQRVDRNEIIPEVKQNTNSPAINPATGEPWYFVFVNNTSSSAGTYESPYPTLLSAQNHLPSADVIYVFPGDGTSKGMNDGITLKNRQMLLGASVPHPISTTRGVIVIPSQAFNLPRITNTIGTVVTLANNNTVSGFYITVDAPSMDMVDNSGIAGTGISHLFVDQNTLVTSIVDTSGLYLVNPLGTIIVKNSTFHGFSGDVFEKSGNGIYVESGIGSVLDSLNILKNSFTDISHTGQLYSGNGFFLLLDGGTLDNLNISNNKFSDINGYGIGAYLNSGTLTNINIFENTMNTISIRGISGVFGGATVANVTVTDNTFKNINEIDAAGVHFFLGGGSLNHLTVSNNTFNISAPSGNCIFYDSQSFTFNVNADISNNTFIGTSGITSEFASRIRAALGNICLSFTNNQATPISSPVPYRFIVGGGGVFNLTPCNFESVNTGTFSLSGVNSVQSCPDAVLCP